MFIKNVLSKITLALLFIGISTYACSTAPLIIPIADAHVSIDAGKSKTSFSIVWKFTKDFTASLSNHDKNRNGKFDKEEQEEIANIFTGYVEANNCFTDIIYTKKDQKIKKSLINRLNIVDSGLRFSDKDIEYYFNFDTDFVLQEDHRLYIRFLDPKFNVNVSLKDVTLNNYSGKNVIRPQNIRANIYFYDYVAKKESANKELEACDLEAHKHDEYHDEESIKL